MITNIKAVKRLILLSTAATATIFSTSAFADSVSENGCMIKEGVNPSIWAQYTPPKENDDIANVPAKVTGGGVPTCYPRSAIENGERFSANGKTYVKISDDGITQIVVSQSGNSSSSVIKQGQWISLDNYPYVYAAAGSGSGSDSGLTDEVNGIKDTNNAQQTAIDNVQNQANQNTNDIDAIKEHDKVQDGRLDDHDTAINAINEKDREQDGRLDGHDTAINAINEHDKVQDGRLDGHDEDLAYLNSQDKISVKYVANENGNPTNQVVLTGNGTGMPVSISNVAAGKTGLDAVNVDQLNGTLAALGGGAGVAADGTIIAPTYNIGGNTYNTVENAFIATNNRIDTLKQDFNYNVARLDGRISDVRNEARAGIAGANALAAMRYDDRPGKASIAMGFGGFKSATAMSAGFGYTTDDGAWRINAGLSHTLNGTSATNWNAGMSWTFN